MVCILTAHPAKFEDTVRQVIGKDPVFPSTITALRSKPHRYTWLRQQSIWRQQWIDTIKRKIQDITNTHMQQQKPLLSLVGVHQTDFQAGTGNALQACVATLLGRSLDSVPNFITLTCGYEKGIKEFVATVAPHLQVCKIMLNHGKDDTERPTESSPPVIPINQLVILRGKSPRGSHGHVVIARYNNGDISPLFFPVHDPHPDTTFLDMTEPPVWCMYFT